MNYKVLISIHIFAFLHFVSSDCPFPTEELENGRILYENRADVNLTTAKDFYILRFECNEGFMETEPYMIQCFNGRWSEEMPACNKMECSDPPAVSNAVLQLQSGVFENPIIGSVAKYKCNPGYQLVDINSTSLTCSLEENKAVWIGINPQCSEKTSCSDPGVSADGSRNGSCCYVEDVVTYSCKEDFELVGDETLTCLPGGKWSSSRPRCRPLEGHCPDPPAIENGRVEGIIEGDYYMPDEDADIVCNPGFEFLGISQYVGCLDTLEWEFEFGSCNETFCSRPEVPENGIIAELESTNATEFPYKYELSYACEPGFRLIGKSSRSCAQSRWSGKDPRCAAIKCYNPGVPENGMRVGSDFSVGRKVVYSCFSGTFLLGSVERYCKPNGQWTGELTRCNYRSNYCPDPGIPINGMKVGKRYNYGDTVRFICQPGFTLLGSEERSCQWNRDWSGEEAKCLGVYDFDDATDVSEMLNEVMSEKSEIQKKEVAKYEKELEDYKKLVKLGRRSTRILNLSHPLRLILYFVFDVSGSVKIHNFQTSIRFAQALVQKVGVTQNGARVGALTFSSEVKIAFYPPHYNNTKDVLDALDKINYTNGGTATNSALFALRTDMIPLTNDHMPNSRSVIFILTDGKANMGGDPIHEANQLKHKGAGVEIYCIGITGSILKNSLYDIASDPKKEHVFMLDNYISLEFLVQEITNGTVDYSKCGLGLEKVVRHSHPRIIGGSQAAEPWPWMAALYMRDAEHRYNTIPKLRCGASIIGRKWILSAAHCFYKPGTAEERPIEDITIRLGLLDVKNLAKLQEFEPAAIIIHPHYDVNTFNNDIAIIELKRPIEYNQYVRPVCLPPKEIPENSTLYMANEIAYAIGWGTNRTIEVGQSIPTTVTSMKNLKQLLLPIQSRERCMQSLQNREFVAETLTDRMFCAGTGDSTGDTCVGDSGGPLMQSQSNKLKSVFWTQVGIVSSGYGCGQKNLYGIYTHVQSLLPWIEEVTKEQ